MGYYPVFLDLDGRPCVVIGGGAVAERKVGALVGLGALVTVVSPALSAGLDALAQAGRVRHVGRPYEPGDLAGFQLAFVATDEGAVNAAVRREGRERGVWVNAADDPARCDFILPAVLRRGELVVAVATGGSSPALSRAIREELEAYFTPEYAGLARIAAEVRGELRGRGRRPSPERWQAALGAGLRRLIAEGKPDEARARLLAALEAPTCD